MKIINTELPGVVIFETDIYSDNRGIFSEIYNKIQYDKLGFSYNFIQDNYVISKRNVLRGLHYQVNNPQGKLVQCLVGKIYDVAIDIRKGSINYLKWIGIELSAENNKQLFIPEGFAHGYCVLSKKSLVTYKCTNTYNPKNERGIIWNDTNINIKWPIKNPILSKKDKLLKEYE